MAAPRGLHECGPSFCNVSLFNKIHGLIEKEHNHQCIYYKVARIDEAPINRSHQRIQSYAKHPASWLTYMTTTCTYLRVVSQNWNAAEESEGSGKEASHYSQYSVQLDRKRKTVGIVAVWWCIFCTVLLEGC